MLLLVIICYCKLFHLKLLLSIVEYFIFLGVILHNSKIWLLMAISYFLLGLSVAINDYFINGY